MDRYSGGNSNIFVALATIRTISVLNPEENATVGLAIGRLKQIKYLWWERMLVGNLEGERGRRRNIVLQFPFS